MRPGQPPSRIERRFLNLPASPQGGGMTASARQRPQPEKLCPEGPAFKCNEVPHLLKPIASRDHAITTRNRCGFASSPSCRVFKAAPKSRSNNS
jgi:hypothetical protein